METHPRENGKYKRYEVLGEDELYALISRLINVLGRYLDSSNLELTLDDIHCNISLLSELIVRIDKRKAYFSIFHNETNINGVKEAALIAYWLLKFKPFSVKDMGKAQHYRNINEHFAIFVLLSAIKAVTQKHDKRLLISGDYLRKLAYAFKYWDISKEALMLVGESLCESMIAT